MERTCIDCQQHKPVEQFRRQREPEKRGEERTADGLNPYCRPCGNKRSRRRDYVLHADDYKQRADAWRAANLERRREIQREYARKKRWGRFGCSPEQAEELLLRADGNCEGCGEALDDRVGITVDHCHTTNVVRGVLCAPCNKAAGLLKDNPERLDGLAAYLRRHAG